MNRTLSLLICLSGMSLAACKADTSSHTPSELKADAPTVRHVKNQARFQLEHPMTCTLGEDCWMMNYVDHDSADGVVRDAKCEARSYDGHKGTDIAIRDWAEVLKGIDILAPASGKVLGVRNGEVDKFPTESDMATIRQRGRECGNGVRIDHGDGWTTQFCHMKKGSVSVNFEQVIRAGTKLGEVGMSGITQHPHMHMTLMKDDVVIDPYTGRQNAQNCGLEDAHPLWSDSTPYAGFSIYDAGFATERPDFKAIARGVRQAEPNTSSPAFIFYMSFFGARAQDEIQLTILQPDGKIFAQQDITQEKSKARNYYFFGKRNSRGRFMSGQWTAKATVHRPDTGERQEVVREIILGE